jgi:hypothetical protein
MTRPDFLIIGAQKSGTTSLREFLGSFPEKVFILKKEQHFWNRDNHYNDGFGIPAYEDLFRESVTGQLKGEKSPSYLTNFEAPARISRHCPEIKLIAILRNPIERAYSAYWHGRRVGAIDPSFSFSDSIRDYKKNHGKPYGDLATPGLYSQHIERYFEFFPKNQLLVLDFQKVVDEPELELTSTLGFLGIDLDDEMKPTELSFPKRNVARTSRFPLLSTRLHKTRLISYDKKAKILRKLLKTGTIPPMEDRDRDRLVEFYSGEISKIEALTGKRFEWDF